MITRIREYFAGSKRAALLMAGFGLLLAAGFISFAVYSLTNEQAGDTSNDSEEPESTDLTEKNDSFLDLGDASLTASAGRTATRQPEEETTGEADASDSSEPGEWETFEATAYTAHCEGCSGVTRTGVDLRENPEADVIAVDPDVIPLGARVEVRGHGEFLAADTGGAITGEKIDIFMPDIEDAQSFGRQSVEIRVIDE